MTQINAIYRGGVFQPLEPVDLRDNEPVRLQVERAEAASFEQWVAKLREHRAAIIERVGVLPDSTALIAADRLR